MNTQEKALLRLYEHTFRGLFTLLYDTLDPVRQQRLIEIEQHLITTRNALDEQTNTAVLNGEGPLAKLKHQLKLTKELPTKNLYTDVGPSQRCTQEAIDHEIKQYFDKTDTGFNEGGPLKCNLNQTRPIPMDRSDLKTGLYCIEHQETHRVVACFDIECFSKGQPTRSCLIVSFPHVRQPTLQWVIHTYSEEESCWVEHQQAELLDRDALKKAFMVFAKQFGIDPPTPIAQKTLQSVLTQLGHQRATHPWYQTLSVDHYEGALVYTPTQGYQFHVVDKNAPRSALAWKALSARKQMQFYQLIRGFLTNTPVLENPVKQALRYIDQR